MAPRVQELPVEGSRDVIERELARVARKARKARKAKKPGTSTAASADDVTRLLGDTAPVGAILALGPSLADIEQAALWYQGDGDMLAKAGHPLEGKAAAIFDLLQADREDPER